MRPAILLGSENGSSNSHEDYKAKTRKLLHGKLLAYIQAQGKGTIKIILSSTGLKSKIIELKNL